MHKETNIELPKFFSIEFAGLRSGTKNEAIVRTVVARSPLFV